MSFVRSVAAAFVLLTTGLCHAQRQPDGRITAADYAELRSAQAEYRDALQEAAAPMFAAFAAEERKLQGNSRLRLEDRLKRTEELAAEKRAFESRRKLPASTGLKPAATAYRRAASAAALRYVKALDAAAERYGKTDLAAAKALLAEKERFVAAVEKAEDPRTVWAGKSRRVVLDDDGGWSEHPGPDAVFAFKEVARTKEYVEVLDESRSTALRLMNTRAMCKQGDGDWFTLDTGGWVRDGG